MARRLLLNDEYWRPACVWGRDASPDLTESNQGIHMYVSYWKTVRLVAGLHLLSGRDEDAAEAAAASLLVPDDRAIGYVIHCVGIYVAASAGSGQTPPGIGFLRSWCSSAAQLVAWAVWSMTAADRQYGAAAMLDVLGADDGERRARVVAEMEWLITCKAASEARRPAVAGQRIFALGGRLEADCDLAVDDDGGVTVVDVDEEGDVIVRNAVGEESEFYLPPCLFRHSGGTLCGRRDAGIVGGAGGAAPAASPRRVAAATALGGMSHAAKHGACGRMCAACGKYDDELRRCVGCKRVWYCNLDCARRHWDEHEAECGCGRTVPARVTRKYYYESAAAGLRHLIPDQLRRRGL